MRCPASNTQRSASCGRRNTEPPLCVVDCSDEADIAVRRRTGTKTTIISSKADGFFMRKEAADYTVNDALDLTQDTRLPRFFSVARLYETGRVRFVNSAIEGLALALHT